MKSYKELLEIAVRWDIQNVRWNKASHTMGFAERHQLLNQMIKVYQIDDC